MITYPLTAAQKNIFSLAQFYKGTSICNIGGIINFEMDSLNYDIINRGINELISSMDAFRIRIIQSNDSIEQYFAEYEYQNIPYTDMRGKVSEDFDFLTESILQKEFDLFESALYRFNVLQTDNGWAVIAVMHHLIADAWSFNLIAEKGLDYFTQILLGDATEIKSGSYIEHITQELKHYESKKYARDKEFWQSLYADITTFSKI